MSIASEIQRLKRAKLDIKQSLDEKGIEVGDARISDYGQIIDEASIGSGIEIDRYLKTVRFTSLNMFGKSEAVLNLDSITGSLVNLFQIVDEKSQNTMVEHLTINCPAVLTTINQMLYCQHPYTDNTLKRLTLNVNTQNCTNYLNAFTQLQALEIIDGSPLDFSSVTSANNTNAFPNCISLKEVRFVPNSIKVSIKFANSNLLSTNTTQSIIDGLATVDTAQTLTLHKDVKILQSQVDSANAKGWTIAGGTVVSEEEYYG